MPEAWHAENCRSGIAGDTGSNYFDLSSDEESSLGEESSCFSDDEDVDDQLSGARYDQNVKVTPILIHDDKEGNKHQEVTSGQVHVQIKTPSRTFSGCRRKIPRTPMPDCSEQLTETSLLELQSRFEKFEVESQEHIKQKCPLQIKNSSLLKKRETGAMAM